jgi:hypothetical protein
VRKKHMNTGKHGTLTGEFNFPINECLMLSFYQRMLVSKKKYNFHVHLSIVRFASDVWWKEFELNKGRGHIRQIPENHELLNYDASYRTVSNLDNFTRIIFVEQCVRMWVYVRTDYHLVNASFNVSFWSFYTMNLQSHQNRKVRSLFVPFPSE